MTLISILVCLILECWHSGLRHLRNYNGLISYAVFLQRHVKTAAVIGSWPGLLIIVLPLIVVTLLIQLALCHVWFGILGWIFNTLILLYCLKPHKFYEVLRRHCPRKNQTAGPIIAESTSSDVGTSLAFFNEGIFAVIFWFCLFGAVGALTYRALVAWRENAIIANSDLNAYFSLLSKIVHYLDWIPARLLALSFAVAGNFTPAFQALISGFLRSPEANDVFLKTVGTEALQPSETVTETMAEDLVFRSLIVWLIVLAVMTLTAVVK